jgi:hypothetical protein
MSDKRTNVRPGRRHYWDERLTVELAPARFSGYDGGTEWDTYVDDVHVGSVRERMRKDGFGEWFRDGWRFTPAFEAAIHRSINLVYGTRVAAISRLVELWDRAGRPGNES